MKLNKIFSQVLLLVALALGIYLFANIGLTYRAKSSTILERLWSQDINNLIAANKISPHWGEIRVVEKIPGRDDPMAQLWAKTVPPPVEINPAGEYKLELLFLSQKNEAGVIRAVIEHRLIHTPTNNYVWELGRTYIIE